MRREDRQPRTLRPKQQHSGEFPGCLFASYIPDLELKSYQPGNTNKTNKQKSTPPPIPTVFRQRPGKGRLRKK